MKRIISIVLALVLILSLSVSAFASDGTPEHIEADQNLLVTLVICLIISLIICFIIKAQMRSVRTENASAYATEQGLNVRVQYDRFTHVTRHVTRVASSRNKK